MKIGRVINPSRFSVGRCVKVEQTKTTRYAVNKRSLRIAGFAHLETLILAG